MDEWQDVRETNCSIPRRTSLRSGDDGSSTHPPLDLALASYRAVLERSDVPEQREVLREAVTTLRGWKF